MISLMFAFFRMVLLFLISSSLNMKIWNISFPFLLKVKRKFEARFLSNIYYFNLVNLTEIFIALELFLNIYVLLELYVKSVPKVSP